MTDTPRLAPLGWGKRDVEHEKQVRARSQRVALKVLLETDGQPSIAVSLALGAACPFFATKDRLLWLEEIEEMREAMRTVPRHEIARLLKNDEGGN